MAMDNQVKQEEELLVLKSIFDDAQLVVDSDAALTTGRFLAAVRLPKPFFVVQKTKTIASDFDACNNAEDCIKKIEVEYLPPLNLFFELPESYPSASPPAFLLSCNWLSLSQISLLCKKLEDLWKDGNGEVILYGWIQFLEEEVLSFLDITDTLDITRLSVYQRRKTSNPCLSNEKKNALDDSGGNSCVPKADKVGDQVSLKPCISGGNGSIDFRAMLDLTNGRMLFTMLEEYNKSKVEDAFNDAWFTCKVCFKEKQGSRFIRFKECNHLYCKECMQSYFEIQIKDGNVGALNCPEEKCNSEAHAMQVKELVDAKLFARYDELLLSRSLDTMPDVTYCPRKFCQSPLIAESGSNMGRCPQCSFVFCMFCRMVYHGIAPCNFKSAEKREICTKYLNSQGEEKELLERRYGKKVLQCLVENALSEEWVDSNSKKCPHCNASIEKTDGCNKMTCFRCGAYFCWLCMTRLKSTNPYSHFSDPNSYCYDRLFPAYDEIVDDDFVPGEFL